MPQKKYINISEALQMCKKFAIPISRPTIIKYVKKYGLGHQIGEKGGKWAIHADRWRKFIDGQNKIVNRTYDTAGGKEDRIQKAADEIKKII